MHFTTQSIARKFLLLSSVLFVIFGLFGSCKKQQTSVGNSNLNPDALLNSVSVDTFSLKTYTESEDSIITSNPLYSLLGAYNDPVFGNVDASFYMQLRLGGLSPNFTGDPIAIDSFVLALEYAGVYGTLEAQTFQVQQMSEMIYKDSSYYQFKTKSVLGPNLIKVGSETFKPNPYATTVVGTDTVTPQLRLPIDTNLARTFINQAGTFTSNENFISYFNGIKVSVAPSSPSSGKGAVFYLNTTSPACKLTIYYKQSSLSKKFDFLINSECAHFNNVTITNSTAVQNVIDNASGQTQFYAQACRSRARVEFPSISSIPTNAIIQKAELVLPISYYTSSAYFPSYQISVATRLVEPYGDLLSLGIVPQYDATRKAYVLDLRDYVQRIVAKQIVNNGLYLAPRYYNTTVDRMIFNGTSTTYKNKPKLAIIYTTH